MGLTPVKERCTLNGRAGGSSLPPARNRYYAGGPMGRDVHERRKYAGKADTNPAAKYRTFKTSKSDWQINATRGQSRGDRIGAYYRQERREGLYEKT